MKANRILILASIGIMAVQTAQAFYNPSTGRWLSRDPISELSFKTLSLTSRKAKQNHEMHLYVFVANKAVFGWDYLGLDNPGCDIPGFDSSPGDSALHDCFLRCCAQHDQCFFTRNGTAPTGNRRCTQRSWFSVLNPCSPCGGCNREALGCFAACLFGGGPQDGDRWFCPNGPRAGETFSNWDDIPDSCWQTGVRP